MPPAPRPLARVPALARAPVVVDAGALAGLADLMQAAEALAQSADVPVPKARAAMPGTGDGATSRRVEFAPETNPAAKRANHRWVGLGVGLV